MGDHLFCGLCKGLTRRAGSLTWALKEPVPSEAEQVPLFSIEEVVAQPRFRLMSGPDAVLLGWTDSKEWQSALKIHE